MRLFFEMQLGCGSHHAGRELCQGHLHASLLLLGSPLGSSSFIWPPVPHTQQSHCCLMAAHLPLLLDQQSCSLPLGSQQSNVPSSARPQIIPEPLSYPTSSTPMCVCVLYRNKNSLKSVYSFTANSIIYGA